MAGKPTMKSDKVLWVTCRGLASHSYEASNEVGGGGGVVFDLACMQTQQVHFVD